MVMKKTSGTVYVSKPENSISSPCNYDGYLLIDNLRDCLRNKINKIYFRLIDIARNNPNLLFEHISMVEETLNPVFDSLERTINSGCKEKKG